MKIWYENQQTLYSFLNQQYTMQIRSDDEQFENLGEDRIDQAEIKESIREVPQAREKNIYRVQIREGENTTQLNIVQNQYYLISVYLNGVESKKNIKRRFSDFDLLFQILLREYRGYLLPGFPENGIVSYVKSKMSLTKDDKFLRDRIALVERFLTIILNDPQFNIQSCTYLQKFFSEEEFKILKMKEKQKSQGLIFASWNKLKEYFPLKKQNKFKKIEEESNHQKQLYDQLITSVKAIIDMLEEEVKISNALQSKKQLQIQEYRKREKKVCQYQSQPIKRLKGLEWELNCEMEDIQMVFKVVRGIEQLYKVEQNYKQIEKSEKTLPREFEKLKKKKKQNMKKYENSFKEILKQISQNDHKF